MVGAPGWFSAPSGCKIRITTAIYISVERGTDQPSFIGPPLFSSNRGNESSLDLVAAGTNPDYAMENLDILITNAWRIVSLFHSHRIFFPFYTFPGRSSRFISHRNQDWDTGFPFSLIADSLFYGPVFSVF